MSTNENFGPAIIKRIAKEIMNLNDRPPEGVMPIINEDNIADVQVWMQGPVGTPYEGGCFRIKLILGAEFPSSPPKGVFLTKIFHPNVSETGEICVNTIKRDWRPDLSIEYVFMSIKTLMYTPNPDSALNASAAHLYRDDEPEFWKRAALLTKIHALKNQVHFHAAAAAAEDVSAVKGGSVSPTRNGSKKNVDVGGALQPALAGDGAVGAKGSSDAVPKKRLAEKVSDREKAEKKRTLRRL